MQCGSSHASQQNGGKWSDGAGYAQEPHLSASNYLPYATLANYTCRALHRARAAGAAARPSLISSLCTHFTRAGIEWCR